jgi:hypothetical protein
MPKKLAVLSAISCKPHEVLARSVEELDSLDS